MKNDWVETEIQSKRFPSRLVLQITFYCSIVGAIFAFISAFWQHLSAGATLSMVKAFSYGTVSAHVGTSAMVCGWIGMVLIVVATLGLLFIIKAIPIIISMEEEGSRRGSST